MKLVELNTVARFCRDLYAACARHKSPRLGAALAYYAMFAITPLFLLTLSIAGLCFGQEKARHELFGQINALVGPEGGRAIDSLILAADRPKAGAWAAAAAVTTLATGAIAAFVELQDALNTIWGVQRKEGSSWRMFIKDRLLSFSMVLGIGFLLLVSLIVDAALAAIGNFAGGGAPERHLVWSTINFLGSLGVVTLLLAMILKVLPDVRIAWRDVWMGAFVTAILFNVGKFLIGYYLGRSSMVSVYGAAGSFIILLLWVYYSAQILFFGAEFTRLYAQRRQNASDPSEAPHPAGRARQQMRV